MVIVDGQPSAFWAVRGRAFQATTKIKNTNLERKHIDNYKTDEKITKERNYLVPDALQKALHSFPNKFFQTKIKR